MTYRINYSPEALKDLDDVWDYIALELCNPSAAQNIINRIINSIDKLEYFPESGTLLSSIINTERDYRYLISNNYMIFYRAIDIDIYIDRILHSKREYIKILFYN